MALTRQLIPARLGTHGILKEIVMALKLQQFLFVVISTFIASAGVVFLGNVTNIFETSWSTWSTIITAGVIGVVSYLVMWLAPQNKQFGLGAKSE
jgi:preprotein translocase subunit SecY